VLAHDPLDGVAAQPQIAIADDDRIGIGASRRRVWLDECSSPLQNNLPRGTSARDLMTLMNTTEKRQGSPDSGSLSNRLRHVYWIGRGSGAGKSTIARRLATEHGLQCYSTDDAMADHGRRCRPGDCPFLTEFQKMSMDERWVNRSPQTMLETFHWFRGEGFGLIVEDLLKLPPDKGVIVEGFRLLPQLVKPLLHDSSHGVWLIPTPEFRLAAFESRGSLWSIAERTSNPARALNNLLERDRLFTAFLRDITEEAGLPVIDVDSLMTESVLEARVATLFGLPSGPELRP